MLSGAYGPLRAGVGVMTSEIAVMNQRGIALAADSAVTLYAGGKIIVRNDQRKLFQVGEGLPVGMMVFGVADLMGHPWEVLLEHYQKTKKPRSLPDVRDYGAELIGMLDHLETLFPPERQGDEYKRLLASVFGFIFRIAHYLRETEQGADEDIMRRAIEMVWQRYRVREDGTPRPDLACFPPGFAAVVERDHAADMEDIVAYSFQAFVLDKDSRDRLREIGVMCVTKDLFLEDVTGLVFAGYGANDSYPSVVSYSVSAVVNGIVKRNLATENRIDSRAHASITMFADSEVTYAFLRGIELDLEARMYATFYAMGQTLVDQVVGAFSNVDPAQRESIRRKFQSEGVPQLVNRTYESIREYPQQAYIEPILSVVEVSTRQDLADMAHDLVHLNIFKKRIMAQRQTVGGAIDVAVISRDKGFSWFKRQGG